MDPFSYNNGNRTCNRNTEVRWYVLSLEHDTAICHIDAMERPRRTKLQGYHSRIPFKDTIKRAEAARDEAEKVGGKFTSYWTFGKYDGIGILEAPNDEAAMQFGLKVGSL